jgi:phenylalanyl-tRNA synthetase beta chain
MRISTRWLNEWVALPGDTTALAERLTMAGLEVDGIEPAAPAFDGVVVGEIVGCEPHPDAERLKVCQVDDGSGEPKTVVCGAPNARQGLKAPFAQVGARLPGEMKIKAAKLRGVKSFGMLCAARELGLAEDSEGLMALPADAPVGHGLRDWLDLDDAVIEVELTPNRSDCLSMAGVAREVGVLEKTSVNPPQWQPTPAVIEDEIPVQLAAPADCPRYCGRVIRDVDVTVATPMWLQERLRRAGIRPLSVVVDITNYLMLELGQPMHAFDAAMLKGGVTVRKARNGETLELLNGETAELDEQTLVIADDQTPVAMAGVMGGAPTAVSDQTVDVFVESAFFAPGAIAGRARAYGLHTDSSHRFERGVDPQGCRDALERATGLLIELAGGRPGPITEAVVEADLPSTRSVTLRPDRVNRLLGTRIESSEMVETLSRLGMGLVEGAQGWDVQVPSWRFDITREVDLIEEVARIHGYDRLPTRRSAAPAALTGAHESTLSLDRARALLVDRGYQEAVTYSFVDPELQRQLDPDEQAVALANPLSADLAVMRTTLWTGLVRALSHNQNRQMNRVRLFETGLSFRGQPGALAQTPVVAGLIAGPASGMHWGERPRDADFFDIKGDVEALFEMAGIAHRLDIAPAEHPALHPGQSAAIREDNQTVGWLGALHPAVIRDLDLNGPVLVFEFAQSLLWQKPLPDYQPIPRYPSIRRDLAVIVDETVAAAAVEQCIREAAGEVLKTVSVFDVYQGKGVSEGCKSLAMGLILQDSSRTLTDDEVDTVQRRVIEKLRQDLGAELRE